MDLWLYNTLGRSKQRFVPGDPNCVTLYVCGPTVYSYAHIGNARPAVVFDLLYRLLAAHYPAVRYARNITDVDDKINAAAREAGCPITDITDRFTRAYHEDLAALGVLPPTVEPRATAHMGHIIAMIQTLLDNGCAYVAGDHVLFDVTHDAGYGMLSGRAQEELLAGARVEVADYKRNAGDFVLWKPSTADLPGWESPWGRGRPGWHMECSAMIASELGTTIDIHGGGSDLVFPHHENEIAQSRCAHGGADLARFWLHNGFVNVNAEKMSKSLGNVLLVRDLLDRAPGEAIRYALLAAHYRSPLDWDDTTLGQARAALDRLYGALRNLEGVPAADGEAPRAFLEALADDLNTPQALAVLFETAHAANASDDATQRARLKGELLAMGQLLGLLQQEPGHWFAGDTSADEAQQIEQLLAERERARAARDFARADAIRDQLAAGGVTIEDGAGGTSWRRSGSRL